MANILGIGIATLDIVNTTDGYPAEDAEVRALSQTVRRGGNVANSLTVLSQLGHDCQWAGTLADDADSRFIEAQLQRTGIDTGRAQRINGGHAPTSYIVLNQRNGSRTIVHYRDLPEFSCEHFLAGMAARPLNKVDWLHAEGRNVAETAKILEFVRTHHPQMSISLEIEKPRDGIETLYGHGDVVFFSRHFATAMQFGDGADYLRAWREKCAAPLLICPWGAQGAYAMDAQAVLYHAPAVQIARLVDTIGAGDTFIAGFVHAASQKFALPRCLEIANALAGKKCAQPGFEHLTLTTVDPDRALDS